MKLWTLRYRNHGYCGGLAVVAAETAEKASEIMNNEYRYGENRWKNPNMISDNYEGCEGEIDSDYYAE